MRVLSLHWHRGRMGQLQRYHAPLLFVCHASIAEANMQHKGGGRPRSRASMRGRYCTNGGRGPRSKSVFNTMVVSVVSTPGIFLICSMISRRCSVLEALSLSIMLS